MAEPADAGYDSVLVKALINLIGVYPVGTCVILDTFEVGIVAGAQSRRPTAQPSAASASPWTRTAATVPPPGKLVSLTEQDDTGAFRRSIVKVTNPARYGLTVGDYFV